MYKIIFILITILLILIPSAFAAKSYLIYDNNSLEIVSLINKDCAVVKKGQTKVVLDKSIKQLGLSKHPTYYKYIDGEIILNTEKISAEYNKKQVEQEYVDEFEVIRRRAYKMALDSLLAEGVNFKHFKEGHFD